MADRLRARDASRRLLVLLVLVPMSLLAAVLAIPLPARAGPCDQVGGVITGDWTISTAQVCTGIFYTVDGSVTINAGGSLTLVDGGLRFAKDASHAGYALTVNAGGELVLDGSTVTTETQAIAPYLKLALTVASNARFTMQNGAALRFPGWFNATSATIDLTDSTITGHPAQELTNLGVYADDNDDSPVIDWASTSASMFRSRIERIYENASAASDPNATGVINGNLVLRSSSALYAYDSYIGADFSNVRGLHNELRVDGTSSAYLFGGTIDRTQDPVSMTDWRPAYVPTAAGGSIYLLRWLHLTAVDSTAFPVSGAMIASTLSPSATTAQFPDNAFATTPSARTLAYLGRTASGATAWNRTDAAGAAVLPYYTDLITTASLPNAESFGNYELRLTSPPWTETSGVDFDAYPAIAEADNNRVATVPFPGLTVRTGPDLMLDPADYPGTLTVIQGQAFTTSVVLHNQGQTDATGASIAAYLDGNRATEFARVNGLTVVTSVTQTLTVAPIGTLGNHTLMFIADPDNTINEGGTAQENNNFANLTLLVVPPPNGFVVILTPSDGQAVEPGSALLVTGSLRDSNGTGIVGVPITIQLRQGSTVRATNLTTSQVAGFFAGTLNVRDDAAEGPYTIVVTPASSTITPDTQSIVVRRSVSFLNVPILGLPVWIWLIVVIGAVAVIGGGTAYMRVSGLSKLVECGECGSFIAADSAACPKCGVEFEKGMAKCSNCQAWIPVSVKQCPECGAEFATGEVGIADYEAQMKHQYDDVKRRFRDEAARELGHALNDREFANWWATQPTFVTFEDWLREEEDMRRMGSKPCPACTTLNSVTATVCHKCGTLLKETPRGRTPAGAKPATRKPAEGEAAAPTDPVPKKPVYGAAVVQKKVIPPAQEAKEGEGGTGSSASEDEDSI